MYQNHSMPAKIDIHGGHESATVLSEMIHYCMLFAKLYH